MIDLGVYDIVKIKNVTTGSVYLESINSIDNKKHIVTTDHFRIKLDNKEVITDLGMYDDDKFELRMAWRLNIATKDYMLWDITEKETQPIEKDKKCICDDRPSNVDFNLYLESENRCQRLESVVLQQATELSELKQALEREEHLKRVNGEN